MRDSVSVFAVRVGNKFWAPMVSTEDQVKTDFIFAINHSKTKLFEVYKDASLFRVASYDLDFGKFKNVRPVLYLEGSKVKFPDGRTIDGEDIPEISKEVVGQDSLKVDYA